MSTLKTTAILALALMTATAASAGNSTVDTFGPINIQSGKVTKQAGCGGGKTAHRSQWIEAPSDRAFVEGSWKINWISANGKNTVVRVEEIQRKPVKLTTEQGFVVMQPMPYRLRIIAHAETGSGCSGVKTAWSEATFSAQTVELK